MRVFAKKVFDFKYLISGWIEFFLLDREEYFLLDFLLDRDPPTHHVDAPPKCFFKHETGVDNNLWWLVSVSFTYDNLY